MIGRQAELRQVRACLRAGRSVILEGPVGVGKTQLALSVTSEMGVPIFRVDGDSRYSEQKLAGTFDPTTVVQKGYSEESFIPGPLVQAMRQGGVLFINEMNRLPEGVQNILLPAIDEGSIQVPRLGEVRSRPGFVVIATQNPKEFVATSQLSEAILDRFELITLDYQSEEEEVEIVMGALASKRPGFDPILRAKLSLHCVKGVRATRVDPRIRRGASIRAAMAWAEVAAELLQDGMSEDEALAVAARMTLPTRIEWDSATPPVADRLNQLLQLVQPELKKKN